MSRYSSIVGFPYAAGIGPYNFDKFEPNPNTQTTMNENNPLSPDNISINFKVETHGIKTDFDLYWSTEVVSGTLNSSHFSDGTLTGTFNVDSFGVATISRTLVEDQVTNPIAKSFKIVIRLGNAINGGIMIKSPIITINDTSLTPLTAFKFPSTSGEGIGADMVAVINVPFTRLIVYNVTGGLGSGFYSFTNSTTPSGLSIVPNSIGFANLNGTPEVTVLTPTTYTVTANHVPQITKQYAAPSTVSYTLAVASTLTSAYKDVASAGVTRWLPFNREITPFIPVQGSGGWIGYPAGAKPLQYTYTMSSIPAGISFSPTTGEVSGSSASATSALTFNVKVQDWATDPQTTAGKQFTMRVATALTTTTPVNNLILVRNTPVSFKPITPTGTAPIASYVMSPNPDNGLLMNASTGIISGTPTAVQASKQYTVTITDVCQPFQSAAPQFSMGFCQILTTSGDSATNRYVAVNANITPFTPVTPTGGHPPLTRAITSPALRGTLTMSASGVVSGVAPATVDSSMITYTMTTTDSSTGTTVTPTRQRVTNTFKLQVVSTLVATVNTPSRIVVINTNVTNLNYIPVTAGNTGSPIKLYERKSGTTALPNNLTVSPTTGQIIGIPNTATSPQSTNLVTYTIRITDECQPQQGVDSTFKLAIAPLLVVNIIKPIVYLRASTATSVAIASITGGWAPTGFPLTVTPSKTLPGTLSISTSGVLAGTAGATINSLAAITINVKDYNDSVVYPGRQDKTSATSFTINTVAALTASTNIASRIFAVGTTISSYRPLNVAGGGGVISYSLPSLPPGLSFSSTNIGFIQGTPQGPVSNASYNISVSDECSPVQSVTGSTSIQIVNAMTLSVNTIPTITEGVAFAAFTPVTASGGTSTKSYTISPALPSGLTMNPATGQIAAGTPPVTGVRSSRQYTVRVIDQCSTPQNIVSAEFTITIRSLAQRVFTSGTSLWTVPQGVTSISMVCVGGAGGPASQIYNGTNLTGAAGGGGGGALAYRNNVAVTPESTVTVVVGAAGAFGSQGFSGFAGGSSTVTVGGVVVCNAGGGQGGTFSSSTITSAIGGAGGTVNVGTGGAGGRGGDARVTTVGGGARGGAGGAGGYSGAGGAGGPDLSGVATAGGAGAGGGGGGGAGRINPTNGGGGAGGGVGVLGEGTSGAGGTTTGGFGGSGGTNGGTGLIAGTGVYGGGNIGNGAVRIMWGPGRAYPSTGVADQYF